MLDEIGCGDAMVFVNPDFDDAIIGTTDDGRAVYSYSRMVECLVRDDGMTEDEAAEFIDYNTLRAIPYMGEKAPVIVMSEWAFAEEDGRHED